MNVLSCKIGTGFWKLFTAVSCGALGDSINPCAIVTLLLFLLLMFSLKKERQHILLLGALYIIGIYISYFLIGAGVLKTFFLFGIPHIVAKIMAVIALVLGILMIYEFIFKKRLKIFTISPKVRLKFMDFAKRGSVAGSFFLGIIVGIFEFPCTGGIYMAVLALLSAKTTYLSGIFWLLFYNLIFVLPLILILIIASNPLVADRFLNFEEQKSDLTRFFVGLIMIGLALIIWFLT